MKQFFSQHKGLHIWLLVSVAPILLLQMLKGSAEAMNFLVEKITTPLKIAFSKFWYLFSFSGAELLTVIFFLLIIGVLFKYGWDLARKEERKKSLYRLTLTLLCMGISAYSACSLFWGANYYADSFQDKSGILRAEVSVDTLCHVTAYFAEKVSEASRDVPRDENGLFNVTQEEFFPQSVYVYGNLEQEYPFLAFSDHVPKKIYFSRFMSQTNFTGFYFPFTGEANINKDFPECLMPATIAHEMAHQRNVASENEANFVAILACTTSGYPAYEYSGYLMGYNYLSNALYRADYDLWLSMRETVAEEVLKDLSNNSRYWSQYNNVVTQVTNDVYDSFLKSYDQRSGIKSYGEVVDLLIAYYGE